MDAVRAFSSFDAVHAFVDVPPRLPAPLFSFFFFLCRFLLLMCVVCVACVCVLLRWRGSHSSPLLFFVFPFLSLILFLYSALECRRVTVIFFLPHRPDPHDRACTRLYPEEREGRGVGTVAARAEVPNRRVPRPVAGSAHRVGAGGGAVAVESQCPPANKPVSSGTDGHAVPKGLCTRAGRARHVHNYE